MKFINLFIKSNILYHIYKLKPKDRIVYLSTYYQNKSYLVINGIVLLKQIISDKKAVTLGIIGKNHIIYSDTTNRNHDNIFEIEAITLTYILTYNIQDLVVNKKTKNFFIIKTLTSHCKNINLYQKMTYIISHKLIKHKFLQLIFHLSLEFGIINNKSIIIPINISKKQIGIIIGSSNTNINQIIQNCRPYINININKKIHINNIINLINFYCY
uniref:Global nitrogen transcriptional regulator n=1 Tax=Anotrichium furcellatum TaxID=41999 RepID=A0A4D6WLY4_9FLOR|nr:global nitrogen transcriptional regulator [Anotrichium furcellatum]